jgi:sterol desaturase/sphingolipid hydroxylase (fatty acid hydroxylase superfamily)
MVSSVISYILHKALNYAAIMMVFSWVLNVLGAAITFVVRNDHGRPKTFREFWRYLFPSGIFTRKSTRLDAAFYVIDHLDFIFILAPLLIGSSIISVLTYDGMTTLFGVHAQGPVTMGKWVFVAIVVTIAYDFAVFYMHYLDHKIQVLWQFHKVHHAAEYLIPITNRRFHPVQQIWDLNGEMLTVGSLLGFLSYAFSMPIVQDTILGVDIYYALNVMSFHHLRHSHINMSYGPLLEKWIMSPAQHHLHHSQEAHHWDKNFGLLLSVWDRMFGTLVYSQPLGSFRVGLRENEGREFQSVYQFYTTPFVLLWRMVRDSRRPSTEYVDADAEMPVSQTRLSVSPKS